MAQTKQKTTGKTETSRKRQETTNSQQKFIWVGGGLAALVFLIVAVVIWQRTATPFALVGGEQNAVVLLRNPYSADYELQYTGKTPVSLERVLPQLESRQQILHVDVEKVVILVGDQEVELDTSGFVPDGVEIALRPGDTFDVRVTYFGQTIGGHNVYGFRIGYSAGGNSQEIQLNVKDKEYTVFVE